MSVVTREESKGSLLTGVEKKLKTILILILNSPLKNYKKPLSPIFQLIHQFLVFWNGSESREARFCQPQALTGAAAS